VVRPAPIAATGALATILLRFGDSMSSPISDWRSWNKHALNPFTVALERAGHTALGGQLREAGAALRNFRLRASVKSASRKGDARPETRRTRMTFEHRLVTAAAALAVSIVATAAEAAPIASPVVDLGATAREASFVDKTASRRCWWRNGQRHCVRVGQQRVYGYRNQGSDYQEHIPEKLPYGSSSWWDQMVRENRGGNSGGGGRN